MLKLSVQSHVQSNQVVSRARGTALLSWADQIRENAGTSQILALQGECHHFLLQPTTAAGNGLVKVNIMRSQMPLSL